MQRLLLAFISGGMRCPSLVMCLDVSLQAVPIGNAIQNENIRVIFAVSVRKRIQNRVTYYVNIA